MENGRFEDEEREVGNRAMFEKEVTLQKIYLKIDKPNCSVRGQKPSVKIRHNISKPFDTYINLTIFPPRVEWDLSNEMCQQLQKF